MGKDRVFIAEPRFVVADAGFVVAAAGFGVGKSGFSTAEHPFYRESEGFTPAGLLALGNSIVTRAGFG